MQNLYWYMLGYYFCKYKMGEYRKNIHEDDKWWLFKECFDSIFYFLLSEKEVDDRVMGNDKSIRSGIIPSHMQGALRCHTLST